MLKRLSTLLFAAALAATAGYLVLQTLPIGEAQAAVGGRAVFFTKTLDQGETKNLGTVPAGRTLLLKDFWRQTTSGTNDEFEILADGVPIFPILSLRNSTDETRILSFSVGLEMPTEKLLTIRRTAGGSPGTVTLFIGATLE